jgi:uncharacterized protein YigA (DUF484 family)
MADKGGLPDFQRYRMAKLQEDFIALRVEHEDLMDLMQESMQRQNRIFSAILALLDSPDFESTLRLIGQDLAEILEVESVGFFFETGGWLDQGDYAYVKIVSPGKVARWLNGGHLVMEEVETGLEELYGDSADKIRSQALVRIELQEGLPPGLLALGHADPMYFATGLATEQIECLGEVIARSLRRFLCK